MVGQSFSYVCNNANVQLDMLKSFVHLVPLLSHATRRPQHILPSHGRRPRQMHTSAMRRTRAQPETTPERLRVSYTSIPRPNHPMRSLKLRLILPSKRLNTLQDVYCHPEHIKPLRGEHRATPLLKYLPEMHTPVYKKVLHHIRSQTAQFPIGVAHPEIFEDTGRGPFTVFTIEPSEEMLEVYAQLRRGFKGVVDTPEVQNLLGRKIRVGIAKQPMSEAIETVRQLNRDFPNGVNLGMVHGLTLVHRRRKWNGKSIFQSSFFLRHTEDKSPSEAKSPTSPSKALNPRVLAPKPTPGSHLGWERI